MIAHAEVTTSEVMKRSDALSIFSNYDKRGEKKAETLIGIKAYEEK